MVLFLSAFQQLYKHHGPRSKTVKCLEMAGKLSWYGAETSFTVMTRSDRSLTIFLRNGLEKKFRFQSLPKKESNSDKIGRCTRSSQYDAP